MQRGRGLSSDTCTEIINRNENLDMNLITLTLNPAVDLHCQTDTFVPFHENLAEITSRDLGGKGVNISRALFTNKISSIPIILIGEESLGEFQEGLKKQIPTPIFLQAKGCVRENITLHSDEGETRISFRGFTAPKDTLEKLTQYLEKFSMEESVITFTGSIPNGIHKEEAYSFLMELKEKGAKLVIDSKSITLEELLSIKPWLIKPNADEIKAYLGKEMSEEMLAEEAKRLHQAGIENVVISLGEKGALLCRKEKVYYAEVPAIEKKSTIGAGDSTIAGFLAAYQKNPNMEAEELLRTATAYGTAACLREGTLPPLSEDIEEVYKSINVKIIII